MEVTLIDPRNATAELDNPTYRVKIIAADRSRIDTWRIAGARGYGDVSSWAEPRRAMAQQSSTYRSRRPAPNADASLRALGRMSA